MFGGGKAALPGHVLEGNIGKFQLLFGNLDPIILQILHHRQPHLFLKISGKGGMVGPAGLLNIREGQLFHIMSFHISYRPLYIRADNLFAGIFREG